MRKENILFICLVIFLQTSLFAQISNTASVEIKYLPYIDSYSKHTDVAMVDDSTSVVFSEVIEDGLIESLFLVREGSVGVTQTIMPNDILIEDIDVSNDTLFFCGSRKENAFVAWADIPTFFSIGLFHYQEISEIPFLSKVKPYHLNSGELNLACLQSVNSFGGFVSHIVQVNVPNNSYRISPINVINGYNEYCSDILVYTDYILVAGYMENNSGGSSFGWSVHMYDKENIGNFLPNNFKFIANFERGYADRMSTAFLAKSKDEGNLVLVSTAWLPEDLSWNGTILSIFRLNQINNNGLNYIYRFDIDSPIPVSMLWDVDVCFGTKGYYDVIMQTYDGGNYSSVFDINMTYPYISTCNIYTNPNFGMYSSIKTYSDYYFISVGDIQWNLSFWDRSLMLDENSCDIVSYQDILLYYRHISTLSNSIYSELGEEYWHEEFGKVQDLEYVVKCSDN